MPSWSWGTVDVSKDKDDDKPTKKPTTIVSTVKNPKSKLKSTAKGFLGVDLFDGEGKDPPPFKGWKPGPGTVTKTPTKPTTPTPKPPKPIGTGTKIVPGTPDPKDKSQINIGDYSSQIVSDPSKFFRKDDPKTPEDESMSVSERDKKSKIDVKQGLIDPNDKKFRQTDVSKVKGQKVDQVDPTKAHGYTAQTTQQNVANQDMTGAKGTVSKNSLVDPNTGQIDMQGMATGVNADGSINYAGQALQKFATQKMSHVIDTSTSAGRALAKKLGEGNYVDSKATLKGQLDILQAEFVGPNGEPKIPMWAQGTARNVSKIAAFGGMTGSAATAAMASALMEASIPIAESDSKFFQTLTIKNLDNKQQSIINTANTLSKMEQANADNRLAAAIQNSKAFLEMDLKNLDNEQQARVINNQNRVQSILEDAKAVNAQRLFEADSQNDLDKFYAQLNTQIQQFNSAQTFDAQKFNTTMEDSRDKFYKEMQYNIAISNAKWRQDVQLQEDTQAHESATLDVKNMVDIGVNQLNQIWDRSDALLDYIWKTSESKLDRDMQLALGKLTNKTNTKNANTTAIGSLVGTFLGSETGGSIVKSVFGGLF